MTLTTATQPAESLAAALNNDDRIIAVAAPQHGACARWQLEDVGVTAHAIDARVRSGRLVRLHRGVYLVPSLRGVHATQVAAALAYGRAAVASHAAAAGVLGMIMWKGGDVAVSVPFGHPAKRAGTRLYRVRLPETERTCHQGVPVTTPVRTLVDYAGVATPRALEQAVATALRKELCTEDEMLAAARAHVSRRGARSLAELLGRETPPAFVRSEAEERFLRLVHRAGLPRPGVNATIGGFEVDFHWATERLIVEVDGMAYHSSRSAQARDRRRDTALAAGGHRVLRFTWFDVTQRELATAVRVAEALARGNPA